MVSSNIGEVTRFFDQKVREFVDPPAYKIQNPLPYARAIEYGHVYNWSRKNPRSKSKIGEFRLPRGGRSVRTMWTTVVTQPPRGMIRRSKRNIAVYSRMHLRSFKPQTIGAIKRFQDAQASYALKEIASKTPRDSGALANAWRIVV